MERKVKNSGGKTLIKCMPLIIMLIILILMVKIFVPTSLGAENIATIIEAKLEKYVNYSVGDQEKGTLVQYNAKVGMEYEKDGENQDQEGQIIKETEVKFALSQIDSKYPYNVKVIPKSTKLTNGKTGNAEENVKYKYNEETGELIVTASNQTRRGEAIRNERAGEKDRDEYTIIATYDTYAENNPERTVAITTSSKIEFFGKNQERILKDKYIERKVTKSIGDLVSVNYATDKIYNGYIKSNNINGTNYGTKYKETSEIMVSKKEAIENIEMTQNNTFAQVQKDGETNEIVSIQDLGNNKNLIYKSTKVSKQDVVNLLGADGIIEIFDANDKNKQNVIATINKDTEYDENGQVTINYENEIEGIIVKLSNVQKEGSIKLENIKEIKGTMTNTDNSLKIITNSQIGQSKSQNVIDIEEATTDIDLKASSTTWTNRQQNEITFTVNLNSNTSKSNMLRNPKFEIELPEEVEKVILGSSVLVYGNGLELQDPYIETSENGRLKIVANLTGEQKEYNSKNLGLTSNVKIVANIILKKDINPNETNLKFNYSNQYGANGETENGNKEIKVTIESINEEKAPTVQEVKTVYDIAKIIDEKSEEEAQSSVNADDVRVEVSPAKGDTKISSGDSIYEGEFIKYNIKITNNSKEDMKDVKLIGTVPEGTTYGELKADYEADYGEYSYEFNKEINKKEFKISNLKAGETVSKYYEVQVNDLGDKEEQKEIKTNIKAYVGEQEVSNYDLENNIKKAETKVFLKSGRMGNSEKWRYTVQVDGKGGNLKVKLPKALKVEDYINITNGTGLIENFKTNQISEENVITMDVKDGEKYEIRGKIDVSKLEEENENSMVELIGVATVKVGQDAYISNENRLLYGYESASIKMTCDSEGQELKYGDEINYNIVITNTGKNTYNGPGHNSISLNLRDFLPENVEPISITYDNYKRQYLDEQGNLVEAENLEGDKNYTATDDYKKVPNIVEEVGPSAVDEDGNKIANINIDLVIPYGETIELKAKATAGQVSATTPIENVATITGDGIKAKTSNAINHTILPYEEKGEEEPITPGEQEIITPNKDVLEEIEQEEGENETEEERRYNISGVAWEDTSEDGQKQDDEPLLSGVKATLINADTGEIATDAAGQERVAHTSVNGDYSFQQVEDGNYMVIFEYDPTEYYVTEYQKAGLSDTENCDATSEEIDLNGEEMIAAITDVISGPASNIDVGFIKTKACDMKLDKTVSKVGVRTVSGTKQLNYNNDKLAKVEIRAKEMDGATVVIEYKLVVSNVGESAATVGKVVDYLPDGLDFSSDLNSSWSQVGNGEIVNVSSASQRLEPGESITLNLVLTKVMAEEETGTFTNKAEIASVNNLAGTEDVDSSNDASQADVIISVSTGAVVFYISIVIIILAIIATAFYLKRKNMLGKVNKISLILLMLGITLFSLNYVVEAVTGKGKDVSIGDWKEHWLVPDKRTYSYIHDWFEDGSLKVTHSFTNDGQCGDWSATHYAFGCNGHSDSKVQFFDGCTGEYALKKDDLTWKRVSSKSDKIPITITMTKEKERIGMKQKDDSTYIYGPFKINVKYSEARNNKITYSIKAKSLKQGGTAKDISSGFSFCDKDGKSLDMKNKDGDITFYVKADASSIKNGVGSITVKAHREATVKEVEQAIGPAEYIIGGNYQPVEADGGASKLLGERERERKQAADVEVTWNQEINTCLSVMKVDYDQPDMTFQGVGIHVTCDQGDYHYDKKQLTNEDGKAHFDNLRTGYNYTITEEENPWYGWDEIKEVKEQQVVRAEHQGKDVIFNLKNIKHTGNLKIHKVDWDSGKDLKNFSFKLKRMKEGKYVIAYVGDQKQEKVTEGVFLSNMEFTDNIEEATEFITDEKGYISVYNIRDGDYEIYETSVNDNKAYDVDDEYISWKNAEEEGNGNPIKVTVNRQKSYYTDEESPDEVMGHYDEVTVKDRRKYIDLTGMVWLDLNKDSKESVDPNGLYKDSSDEKDLLLKGIKVELVYHRDGASERYTRDQEMHPDWYPKGPQFTDEEGNYLFERVLIDELQNYDIRFSYNGLNFESVPATTAVANGSKASEVKEAQKNVANNEGEEPKDGEKFVNITRDEFNQNYATIEHDKSNKYDLDYNDNPREQNYKADLLYDKDHRNLYNYGNDEWKGERDANGTVISGYGGDPVSGSYDEKGNPIGGMKEQYVIQADIHSAYDGYINSIVSEETIRKTGMEIIEHINLGIKKREMPDLSILQDVYKANVYLNDYGYEYRYSQRFKDLEKQKAESNVENFNINASFGKKGDSVENRTYTREIYPSDMVYAKNEGTDRLKVFVTYRIMLMNESTSVYTAVNRLTNRYDPRCNVHALKLLPEGEEFESTGAENPDENTDTDKIIEKTIEGDIAYSEPVQDGEYSKTEITSSEGIMIAPGKTRIVEITYQLNSEAIVKVLDEETTLDSITEISSYSSFKNQEPYAGIDEDSNPDNTAINTNETYEDDVDRAPSLILKAAASRVISGTIWHEDIIEELANQDKYEEGSYYYKERIGNGLYEKETEKVLENVDVELIRTNSEINKNEDIEEDKEGKPTTLYPKDGVKTEAKMTTKEDGYYEFIDPIPGKYILKYTYKNNSVICDTNGNKITLKDASKGQDDDHPGGVGYYKSTLYRTKLEGTSLKDRTVSDKKPDGEEGNFGWYAQETLRKQGERLSDAKDVRSMKIDEAGNSIVKEETPKAADEKYKEIVEYRNNAEALNHLNYEEIKNVEKDINAIDAETSCLELQIDSNVDILDNIWYAEQMEPNDNKLQFIFDQIDFGIVRRPVQDLKVSKKISHVKVVSSNGATIIDGDPSKNIPYVKYLPDGNIHIELEDEVMQDAKLFLTYEVEVDTTKCEIDYNDKDYYYYGKLPEDKKEKCAISRISKLYDYFSPQLDFNLENNEGSGWKTIKVETLQDEENKGDYANEEILNNIIKNYKTILSTNAFENMEPGTKKSEKLVLTKILGVTDKDLTYGNVTEAMTYTNRRDDNTYPGNYDPTTGATKEDDTGEVVATITNPTGENRSYATYIIIGITAFAVLGIGIIIIKKKTLKK